MAETNAGGGLVGDPAAASLLAPQDPNWLVDLALREAVTNAERRFALLRAGFCGAVGLSFIVQALDRATGEPCVTTPQVLFEGATVLFGVLFSFGLLRHTARASISPRASIVSALFDSLLCVFALASNQFAPAGTYHGVLASMDVAILPIVMLTSVLRVSGAAVLASSLVTSGGIVMLAMIDTARGFELPMDKALLFCVYQGSAILLSAFITRRALEIFGRVGRVASRAEHARGSLVALLSDHHDVRSDLCDLKLQVELLGEALDQDPCEIQSALPRVRDLRVRIEASTQRLTDRTSGTRQRALSALEGGGSPESASCIEAILGAARHFVSVHPNVTVDASLPPELPSVLACGGTTGLVQVISHLLENAREGDGVRGARRIAVRASLTDQTRVEVIIEDDGPGIPAELQVRGSRMHSFSTKPGSLGIGLRLTEAVLRAAAGELILENAENGARARVRLRVAPPSG